MTIHGNEHDSLTALQEKEKQKEKQNEEEKQDPSSLPQEEGDGVASPPPVRIQSDEHNKGSEFGFLWRNTQQLFYHCLLSVLIGVTLRMTTYKDATIAADIAADNNNKHHHNYTQQTAFLVSFGFTKAVSDLLVGRASDLYGRKRPHCFGWFTGVVLGVLLLWISNNNNNNDWTWYVLANTLLGMQQGIAWTTNIFMFMDVLGPSNRAIASGISNSVGYLSSAVTTYVAAASSTKQAFSVVLVGSIVGLAISVFLVEDTTDFVAMEMKGVGNGCHRTRNTTYNNDKVEEDRFRDEEEEESCCYKDRAEEKDPHDENSSDEDNEDDHGADVFREEYDYKSNKAMEDDREMPPTESLLVVVSSSESHTKSLCRDADDTLSPSPFGSVLIRTCWHNRSTAVLCLGGLLANLVTSLAWGLVLIWAQEVAGIPKFRVATIGAAFTFAKASSMVVASRISDNNRSRKPVLVGGFAIAIVGLVITALADTAAAAEAGNRVYDCLLVGGIVIGCGIGSVYCVMAGGISDHSPAKDRASAIGVYKLWRDSGYAVGGLVTGVLADVFEGSFVVTTLAVAGLVGILVVGVLVFYREGRNGHS